MIGWPFLQLTQFSPSLSALALCSRSLTVSLCISFSLPRPSIPFSFHPIFSRSLFPLYFPHFTSFFTSSINVHLPSHFLYSPVPRFQFCEIILWNWMNVGVLNSNFVFLFIVMKSIWQMKWINIISFQPRPIYILTPLIHLNPIPKPFSFLKL